MGSNQRKFVLVVVNGKSKMGEAVAVRLTQAGHEVVLAGDYVDRSMGADGKTYKLSWAGLDSTGLEKSVFGLIERFPKVDILVIAGDDPGEDQHRATPVENLKSSDWNAVILKNLTAAFLVVKAYIPGMQKQQWGRLVFMVPEEVRARPDGSDAHLVAAKAGLIGLARTLVHELGPDQVTVNCVASGTGSQWSSADDTLHVTVRKPEAIDGAEAVAFLTSEGASFITGMTLDVNGGRTML